MTFDTAPYPIQLGHSGQALLFPYTYHFMQQTVLDTYNHTNSSNPSYYVWTPEEFLWYWTHVYLPITYVAVAFLGFATFLMSFYKAYSDYPSILLRFIIYVALGWEIFMCIKWTPGITSNFFVANATVDICRITAAIDSFVEFSHVTIYTFMMFALFYYTILLRRPRKIHRNALLTLYVILLVPCTVTPFIATITPAVNWCVVDADAVWYTKLAPWMLLLTVQMGLLVCIMIALTRHRLETEHQPKDSKDKQIRLQRKLIMMLLIQIFGWFPVMVLESFNVTRHAPPAILEGIIGVCTPLSDVFASWVIIYPTLWWPLSSDLKQLCCGSKSIVMYTTI